MSKTVRVLVVIAVCLVVIGAALIGIGLINGGMNRANYQLQKGSYELSEYTYEPEDVKSLYISAVANDIDIMESGDDLIRVACYDSEYEWYDVYLTDNGKLTISYRDKQRWWFDFKWYVTSSDFAVTVYVPRDLLEEIDISQVSGNVHISDVNVKDSVSVDTVSGYISLWNMTISETCKTASVSGLIRLENVSCADVSADTISGEVVLIGVQGKDSIVINTTSGRIRFEDVRSEDVQIDTVSGNVVGNLIGDPNDYIIDVDTLSGTQNVPRSGDGPFQLEVNTTSGDVDIEISK